MNRHYIFILLIIAFFSCRVTQLNAQKCGTRIPENFVYAPVTDEDRVPFRDTVRAASYKIHYVPEMNKPYVNLSISAYVTGSFLSSADIETAIDSMNYYFEPSGISFSLCNLEYIDDPDYANITSIEAESAIAGSYNIENTINVYFVDSLISLGEIVCGIAYLPVAGAKLDFIFISKSCDIPKNLTHEMGHCFGLLHPHDTEFGAEFANGSNCTTAGDLVCDTEASPNLYELVNEDCEYVGMLNDPQGQYYWPSVSNLMSYSRYKCLCLFTAGQIQRMIESYYLYKSYLR